MHALVLALAIAMPTPTPSISPLPAAIVQWYAQRGASDSGLDPALVHAVIDAESGGDPKAVSNAGAVGMMQLTVPTANECGIHDRFDALQNVACGARTLGYLVHRDGIIIGIAAYNFGSGNVEAASGHLSKMPIETQTYVKNVVDTYDRLQHESVAARSPTADPPKAPVARFDTLVNIARAGCDALGESVLFIPTTDAAIVADVLSARSSDGCRGRTMPASLDGLAFVASIESYEWISRRSNRLAD